MTTTEQTDYNAMPLDQLYTEKQILVWQNNQLLTQMDVHNAKLTLIRRAIVEKERAQQAQPVAEGGEE